MRRMAHRYWTEEDIAFVATEREAGTKAAIVAAQLGRSRSSVFRIHQRMDVAGRAGGTIVLRKHRNWFDADIDALREYVKAGKSNAEIGKLLGRTLKAVVAEKSRFKMESLKPVVVKAPVPIIPIFVAPKPLPVLAPAKLTEPDEDLPEFGADCALHLQDLRRCRSRWATITAENLRRSA